MEIFVISLSKILVLIRFFSIDNLEQNCNAFCLLAKYQFFHIQNNIQEIVTCRYFLITSNEFSFSYIMFSIIHFPMKK